MTKEREFVEHIARLYKEEEMSGGYKSEDSACALTALIEEARMITGIEPGYDVVYCIECGVDYTDCACGEEGDGV